MKRSAFLWVLLALLILVSGSTAQQMPRIPTPPLRPIPQLAIPLQLPPLQQWLAESHAAAFAQLPGFRDVTAAQVFPVYDLDGETLAYYEVKYTTGRGDDAGYVMLSATQKDLPIVEFSHHGLTHHERFAMMLQEPFRMIRYGSGYIVAEDERGHLLGEIGFRPQLIPYELWEQTSHIERDEGILRPGDPAEPFKDDLDVPLLTIRRELQDPVSYQEWKERLDPQTFVNPDPEYLRQEWEELLMEFKMHGDSRSGPEIVLASSSGCSYDIWWIPAMNNRPYILQLSANTGVNHTNCASGCGPTAWINIYAWHRLNSFFAPVEYSKYNTTWIDEQTMELRSYLRTRRLFCNGFTWHYRMGRGIPFAETAYNLGAFYHWRWSLFGWVRNSDSAWVFQVAREMAKIYEGPFVVGYFSDWHYAVGYAIAECRGHGWRRHSWAYIYPAWSRNDSDNKWINKRNIFGIWGVHYFVPTGRLRSDGFLWLFPLLSRGTDQAAATAVASHPEWGRVVGE